MKNYCDFHKAATERGLVQAIYIAQVHGVCQRKINEWVKLFERK